MYAPRSPGPFWFFVTVLLLCPNAARAEVPATPVMTLYKFGGELGIPFFHLGSIAKDDAKPAGTLAQGSALIPCLVIQRGKPLTTPSGTPMVGFTVVFDAETATAASVEYLQTTRARRRTMRVENHHCDPGIEYVIDVRLLIGRDKDPVFDPPVAELDGPKQQRSDTKLVEIVRAFHNSAECAAANQRLVERRMALDKAWQSFVENNTGESDAVDFTQARHLDYVMRTTIYEGHIGRGCNAYGACERNVIALSIRNRARTRCHKWQGCEFEGDFKGVVSLVSQYNIWDEYLTQISGLTSCFLRDDLAGRGRYHKLQEMFAQSVGDVERILFATESEVEEIFNGTPYKQLSGLRHYYHPPAMGQCFPKHPRVEYISGAIAAKGDDYIAVVNSRVQVGKEVEGGYRFRSFVIEQTDERDVVTFADDYPGFVLDGRKVALGTASGCTPYGVPRICHFDDVGRYRKPPFWLSAGKALALTCSVNVRGDDCTDAVTTATITTGGICDTEMQPIAGVH